MKTLLLGTATLVALSLSLLPARANGPSFLQTNGSATVSLPLAAPNGVLTQIANSRSTDGSDCPPTGSVLWTYDRHAYNAGDSFQVGVVHYPEDWYLGGSYTSSLFLPGGPPFDFSGVLTDTDECGGSQVAFIAPSDNTYQLNFGVSSGSYTALIGRQLFNVSGPGSRAITLTAGVYVVSINATHGASWEISGDDSPPMFTYPSEKRLAGVPGFVNTFSVGTTESGNVNVQILSAQGSPVRELVTNDKTKLGAYRFSWDGTLANGGRAAASKYIVRVTETDWRARTVTHDFLYMVTAPTPKGGTKPTKPTGGGATTIGSGVATGIF